MKQRKNIIYSFLFLLPALLLFVTFLLNPIFQAIIMSFYKWKGIAGVPMDFVGLNNYKSVLSSSYFWLSMRNSFILMAGGFIILMPLAFGLALIITSNIKGVRFFKTAFFMPVMLPITAVGLMWSYILEPNWGLVNSFLNMIGKSEWAYNWLATPTLNVIVVTLVNEWIFAGLNMLIFAAGLVAIPTMFYEAAVIDGANTFEKFRYITLPLMKGSFKIFAILCVTGSLKTFDLMFSMTKGGPNHASEVPATLLYSEAFASKNFGNGNTIGVLILIFGLVLSIVINKMLDEKEMA